MRGLSILAALLFAVPALADEPTFHVGPSASAYEARLSEQVGQFAAGLGMSGWVTWPNQPISPGLTLFGSALGLGTATPGWALSVSPYACDSQYGICLGPLFDLLNSKGGGVFHGFTWKQDFGVCVNLQPKFFQLLHAATGSGQ
jgi:hypothetical protein